MEPGWEQGGSAMISFPAFQIIMAVLLAVAVAIPLFGCWRLCRRVGLPGWASLVILVPVANAAAVFWLAFAHLPRSRAMARRPS